MNQIEIKYLSQKRCILLILGFPISLRCLNVCNFILFTVQFKVYYKDNSVVPALD